MNVLHLLLPLLGMVVAGAAASAQTAPSSPSNDDRDRLSARYEYEDLSDLPRWLNASLEYAHRTSLGVGIVRVNAAERFGAKGKQLEAEFYPVLGKRAYLTLGVSVSGDHNVYIPLRLMAEPYVSLPNAWEASLGGRYLQIPGPDVKIVTGTIGKYAGNYWVSLRPSVSVGSGPSSRGLSFTTRKYFSGRYDYVGLSAGRSIGVDADVGDPTRFNRPRKLGTSQFHLDRHQPISKAIRISYGAGFISEQVAPGRRRDHRLVNIGVEWFAP